MSSILTNAMNRLGLGGTPDTTNDSSAAAKSNGVGAHGGTTRPKSHLDGQGLMTKDNGAPLDDDKYALRAGRDGPVLMQDYYLFDKLAHFNRERIPERVVHAHGAAAHGYFEVTNDITQYCKADLFSSVGKKTPVFCRFSTVRGGKDSTEANRDPRGFSIKHYTNEGNWDMVGNNTPIFFIRNPAEFVNLIHVFKPDPRTLMPNFDAVYDWAAGVPESVHQMIYLMGPRGLPKGWIHMQGYSSHTFKWVNAKGDQFFVKMHYLSNNGPVNKGLTQKEADGKGDPYFATRELFAKLDSKQPISWTMKVQIVPVADVPKLKYNLFDLTKTLPRKDYPLIEVGKLHLTHGVTNNFAENEQVSYSPGNLVPGIEPSPDPVLQSRLWSYNDAHRHRIGANYSQLPINCPFSAHRSNDQDGHMCMAVKSGANYFPNTQGDKDGVGYSNGCPHKKYAETPVSLDVPSTAERFDWRHPNSDYEQPAELWNKVFDDDDRAYTIENFAQTLKPCRKSVQDRFIAVLDKVDKKLSSRVREALDKLPESDKALH